MAYLNLETTLKLKRATPADLKEIKGNKEFLRKNFSIYIYDPVAKYISGPFLLTENMDLQRLARYLTKGFIYIPESIYKYFPKVWEDLEKDKSVTIKNTESCPAITKNL